MTRVMAFAAMLMLAATAPSIAGENPSAKLAMHVVASDQYLACLDLTPAACDSIDVDVSAAEILATGGYGYVAFVAYDVEGLTGAEFAISGWPSGRGAPQLSDPYWCPEGTLTMGEHLGSGGIAVFPCVEASAGGLVLAGYCSFGPLEEEDLPITLEYSASSFSYPNDPHNYVLDCTVEYQEDSPVASTGCTIGGMHETQPDCTDELGDEDMEGESQGEQPGGGGEHASVIVETGLLYVYGNRLDPPYSFTIEGGQLFVNGVRLHPPLRSAPTVPGEPTDSARAQHALEQEAYGIAYSLLEQETPVPAIAESVAAFFRGSELVASVTRSGQASLSVQYEDVPFPLELRLPRHLEPPDANLPSESERCAKKLRLLTRSLRLPGIVFFGDGYLVATSQKDDDSVEREIQILRETEDPNAAGLETIYGCVAEDLLSPTPLQ